MSWIAFAVNFFGTIARRTEKALYVSTWYWMGSMVGISLVWIVGNRTFVPLDGLNDALQRCRECPLGAAALAAPCRTTANRQAWRHGPGQGA